MYAFKGVSMSASVLRSQEVKLQHTFRGLLFSSRAGSLRKRPIAAHQRNAKVWRRSSGALTMCHVTFSCTAVASFSECVFRQRPISKASAGATAATIAVDTSPRGKLRYGRAGFRRGRSTFRSHLGLTLFGIGQDKSKYKTLEVYS